MKITVYDSKNAPKWVRAWNLLNLFITGFVLGHVWAVGWGSSFLPGFSLYIPIYAITVGHFFTPKKEIDFPGEFFQHLKEQFPAI
jgi:fatty acid desaturase